jgi:predicted anti-sigma-YlaC factor YlaD
MRCHDCRIAISARLDGEDPGRPAAAVEAHLAGCDACRAFATGAESLHRSVRLTPAAPMADLTPAILETIGREARERDRSVGLRVCLALVGVLQIAVAVPALILGDDAGLPVHAARHIGSFAAALAVGYLFVAWKPERAAGLLPVATALVAFVLGTTVLDVVAGQTAAFSETGHVTEIVGLAITWLLARPGALRRPSGAEVAPA